jgi:hypothetical protein
MSHHFDTPTAREDPRINVCDFYLFDGAPGTTVMALTVNPDAGLSAPDFFRDEGLYAFRFDLNGDAREEVTLKFRFGDVRHADGDDHRHVQNFEVRRATGEDAFQGLGGEVLIAGETGVAASKGDIRAFAGLAPELFAGSAGGLRGFMEAFYKEKKFYPEAFVPAKDFFSKRNVSAVVLQVPTALIGQGTVRAWATASLVGHAPEVQVSRWGLPLLTHIFLSDPTQPDLKEAYNRSTPSSDVEKFAGVIGEFAQKMATYAESSPNPVEYGRRIGKLFCPTTLPYELGSVAAFDYTGFNGRPLGDDVMDVMLTLAANRPVGDGVVPDKSRIRAEFPYYGAPYSKEEQVGVVPAAPPKKK